jgi:penicillin-binding protein 2
VRASLVAYRTPVTDHSYHANLFRSRAVFAAIISLGLLIALLVRLGYLQVIENTHFSDLSENNRVRLMALPPNRGLIYDRNGVVLAENQPAFHLELIPEQVDDLDATLVDLGKIVRLSEQDIRRFYADLRNHRPFESVSLRSRLNDEEVARLAANRHRFPGMDITARLSRYYPHGKDVVHAVGYVGRITERDMDIIDVGNYRGTNYIGKTGLEKYYEDDLHGIVGQQNVEVNAEGRILRVIDKISPVPGNDLVLSLDLELQQIADAALGDLAGAVVAIHPQTGEVLVFVSKPTYDPNLFVEGIGQAEYDALSHGDYKPLFNRALYGQYPPGSAIKPFIGLGALDGKAVGEHEDVYCSGYYLLPGDDTERKYRDWKKEGHGHTDMNKAIEESCDVYFYEMSRRMGIDRIHDFLSQFGFGEKSGIDLLGERSGLLPSTAWKERVHRKVWYPGETLIAGIGQGFVLTTPLQLASATSTLANRGIREQPHLVREIRNSQGEYSEIVKPEEKTIKLRNDASWDAVFRAMRDVLHGTWGTARLTGYGLKYKMAGKTGTAQVFGIAQGEEYDKETVAKKLRDHGLFIAFAPYDDPQIAVAVVAENGEHGSAVAPIARKIIDHYLHVDKSVKKASQAGRSESSN